MAALTAALLAISAGASIYNTLSQKKPKTPAAPTLPAAPDPNAAALEAAQALTRLKGTAAIPGSPSSRSGTLLTGPAGLASGTPPPQQKTLLGL